MQSENKRKLKIPSYIIFLSITFIPTKKKKKKHLILDNPNQICFKLYNYIGGEREEESLQQQR